jgi:hypothetical protein
MLPPTQAPIAFGDGAEVPILAHFQAVIPARPISKNAYQRFTPQLGHAYVTREGREFQALIRRSVRAAMRPGGWNVDPFAVEHVKIVYRKYNVKFDCLAGAELILDAIQFAAPRNEEPWGLYGNDRAASVDSPQPGHDGTKPRITLDFYLLSTFSDLETIRYRESWKAQEKRRAVKREAKAAARRPKESILGNL